MSGEWIEEDALIPYRWDLAEFRRLNRDNDETAELYQRLARQRVRHIVGMIGRRG